MPLWAKSIKFSPDTNVKTQSPDTSPEAERFLVERTRQMPVHRKLQLAWQWSAAMRQLAWSDVQHQHPRAPVDELWARFAERTLGPELAAKVLRHHASRRL